MATKIADIAARQMTEMQARSTKVKPTPTHEKIEVVPRFNFETFAEPQLMAMLTAARQFVAHMNDRCMPAYWLSFLGASGNGKTFLAKQIYDISRTIPRCKARHEFLIDPIIECKWLNVLDSLRDGKHWWVRHLSEANVVFIDDIGSENPPTDFGKEKLFRILDNRLGKWTILTSNLTKREIALKLDIRISSRLIRGDNIQLETNTTDYALRKRH